MSTTRLVLIRHGESVAQVDGFHAGHEHCRGLSALGRRQVTALADRFAGGELGQVDILYSSLMARAVETAQILAPAIGHEQPVRDCGVCEIHPGAADGLTWDEIQTRWPAETGVGWNPDDQLIDGAESWAAMHDRIKASMARIATDHDGATVVIACHGGVIAHAMASFLGTPLFSSDVAWTMPTNASITEFVFDRTLRDWRQGRWGLVRYNDHAHLHGV